MICSIILVRRTNSDPIGTLSDKWGEARSALAGNTALTAAAGAARLYGSDDLSRGRSAGRRTCQPRASRTASLPDELRLGRTDYRRNPQRDRQVHHPNRKGAATKRRWRTSLAGRAMSFCSRAKFGAVYTHCAELELRNLAERIKRGIGEQIRGRLRVTERHENHVLRHVPV